VADVKSGVSQTAFVGLGELKIVRREGILACIGLGSCVGTLLYDVRTQTGVLAHVMLPDSSICNDKDKLDGKYANTAVPALLQTLADVGISKSLLVAALIGGAELFKTVETPAALRIGARNVDKVSELLRAVGVPIVAREVGGSSGRSLYFNVATGKLEVKVCGMELRVHTLGMAGIAAAKAA
jgi:chemotaxis protein CheD